MEHLEWCSFDVRSWEPNHAAPVVGNEQAWRDHLVVAVLVFERRADFKEEPESYAGFQQQYRRQRAAVTFCSPNPAV